MQRQSHLMGLMKQKSTAPSICEANYTATTAAVQRTAWLRRILRDILTLSPQPTPFLMYNYSVLLVPHNTRPTKRHKYIDLQYQFLTQHALKGHIKLSHFSSTSILAEILTKPLPIESFGKLTPHPNIIAAPSNFSPGIRNRTATTQLRGIVIISMSFCFLCPVWSQLRQFVTLPVMIRMRRSRNCTTLIRMAGVVHTAKLPSSAALPFCRARTASQGT